MYEFYQKADRSFGKVENVTKEMKNKTRQQSQDAEDALKRVEELSVSFLIRISYNTVNAFCTRWKGYSFANFCRNQ